MGYDGLPMMTFAKPLVWLSADASRAACVGQVHTPWSVLLHIKSTAGMRIVPSCTLSLPLHARRCCPLQTLASCIPCSTLCNQIRIPTHSPQPVPGALVLMRYRQRLVSKNVSHLIFVISTLPSVVGGGRQRGLGSWMQQQHVGAQATAAHPEASEAHLLQRSRLLCMRWLLMAQRAPA
jgi:hypothetical protein